MSTTLTLIMDGLAARITAGAFVDNVYAYPSKQVVPPCAVVDFPDKMVFDLTFQGSAATQTHNTYELPVWFLVVDSGIDARDALSDILTDATSIKTALDGSTSFGAVRVMDASIDKVVIASVPYIGVRFDVEVLT